jgi:Fur family transcriptional regulator, peroxide stress response regulator
MPRRSKMGASRGANAKGGLRRDQPVVSRKVPSDRRAEHLRKAGLRLTIPRLAVFRALVESHSHPTAEEIYQAARRRVPRISRNTVYLNLDALRRIGATTEVQIGHKLPARFESNIVRHDHAVCVGCSTIVDIYDPRFQKLTPPRTVRARFHVLSYRVDFFGLCKRCQALRRRALPQAGSRGS